VAAYLPVAIEALTGGDTVGARKAYDRAASTGPTGASLAAIGLADIALFEGRYEEAIAALPAAIEADKRDRNAPGAAAKLIALAEAHAGLGRVPLVLKNVEAALATSRDDATVVAAARLFLKSGSDDRAQLLIKELSARLSPQPRAYASILQAERAIARGQRGEAIDALAAAKKLADLWLGRLVSGIAYETFGHRVEARDELAMCAKRLGEASAIFLDDSPTFRYARIMREWQERAKGATAGAAAAR
jgi:tetratricopeptide (TPR) repeat protein